MKVLFAIAVIFIVAVVIITQFRTFVPSEEENEFTAMDRAVESGLLSECEKAGYLKDECELEIISRRAIEEDDRSLCDSIKEKEECRRRYDVALELVTECSSDECYYIKAVGNKNPELCSLIQNQERREDCLERFEVNNDQEILRQVMEGGDKSLCNQIIDESIKDICLMV